MGEQSICQVSAVISKTAGLTDILFMIHDMRFVNETCSLLFMKM